MSLYLRDLFTGESSGGEFTLMSVSKFPSTIHYYGAGQVVINSIADLPHIFNTAIPYNTLIEESLYSGGDYQIRYCVSGCNGEVCTNSTLKIVEKPILGGMTNISRCSINGTLQPVNVCFNGTILNKSNNLPYDSSLNDLIWKKSGVTIGTGNCITIPTTISSGIITVEVTSVVGGCTGLLNINLIDDLISAGVSVSKKLCIDKHQIEIYKNTPAAPNPGIVNLNLVFPGGNVPFGGLDQWVQISGPSVVSIVSNNLGNFSNALIGTYVFSRTVSKGLCSHTVNYTVVLKYCTRGDQVKKVTSACKLNVLIPNFAALTASLLNPNYAPIATGGCFYYLGSGPNLDMEVNGVLVTNVPALYCFPYNASIKIVTPGVYDFEYTSSHNLSGCTSCGATTDELLCDCDYYSSNNYVGTINIDTTGAAPNAGASKIYIVPCNDRKLSLFSKFNDLNGNTVDGGGVWTYQALALPQNLIVDGVPITITFYGQVIPGTNPLIDFTGVALGNMIFRYTVTNSCGTSFKNFTIGINCDDCNGIVSTTMTKTDCTYNYTIEHPVTGVQNRFRINTQADKNNLKLDFNRKLTGTCGTETSLTSLDVRIINTMVCTNMTIGDKLKSLKVFNAAGTSIILDLDPSTTPYTTGCGGTISPAALALLTISASTTVSVYTGILRILIRNALCTAFSTTTSNYNFTVVATKNGNLINVQISSSPKHNASGEWLSLPFQNGEFKFTQSGINQTVNTVNVTYSTPEVLGYSYKTPCDKYPVINYFPSGLTIPYLNLLTSTNNNYVLNQTFVDVVVNPALPQLTATTCKQFNFNTSLSPVCSVTPTYSYKVNGVLLPETTASFVRLPFKDDECNPFNPGLTQTMETTVLCATCSYVKNTIKMC